jgi:hypothetical protein
VEGFGDAVVRVRKAENEQEKEIVKQNGGVAGVYEIVLKVDEAGSLPSSIEERIGDGTIRIGFSHDSVER